MAEQKAAEFHAPGLIDPDERERECPSAGGSPPCALPLTGLDPETADRSGQGVGASAEREPTGERPSQNAPPRRYHGLITAEFVRRYQPRLLALCRWLTRNDDDAQDLFQQV